MKQHGPAKWPCRCRGFRDSSRRSPPMERPGVQEKCWRLSREGQVGAVMMPASVILAGSLMRVLLVDRISKTEGTPFTPKTPLRFPFLFPKPPSKSERGATHDEFSLCRPPHVAVQPAADKHLKVLFQQCKTCWTKRSTRADCRRHFAGYGFRQRAWPEWAQKQMMRA